MNGLKKYIQKVDTILIFLILECLALVGFALGGVSVIYYYIGFALSLASIPFIIVFTSKKDMLQLLYVAIPIVILAILIAVGGYSRLYLNSATTNRDYTLILLDNIGVFFAIVGFFFLGYAARRINKFKIEKALLCVGSAIALWVFISLVITWASYGMFYTLIYRDTPNYFYNGDPYNLLIGCRWLMGFKIETIDLRYAGQLQVLLLSSFAGLFFVNPKKEWKRFLIIALIGSVGLLSCITIMNWKALLFVIPLLIVALGYRYLSNKKTFLKTIKWICVGIAGLFTILLVIVFVNVSGKTPLTELIASNRVLDKLFNGNRVIADINDVIRNSINPNHINWFGFNDYTYFLFDTGSFEFEIIKDAGLIGFVVLLFLMCTTYFSVKHYIQKSKDTKAMKAIIFAFLVLFTLYNSFFYDSTPFIFVNQKDIYFSFYRSLPFLIVLFIIGYTFYPLHKDVIPLVEDESYRSSVYQSNTKEEVVDKNDEYNFTTANDSDSGVTISDEIGGNDDEEPK